MMPTPECWEELGKLRAEVTDLHRHRTEFENRIAVLEHERVRLKTIGGVIAFLLTGVGVFFAEPIKKLLTGLFSG